MNKSFWQSFVSQVNQARAGTIDALYLQAYAGGSSNNPCNWDVGLPVYVGLWSRDYSPSGVQTKMQRWKNSCENTVKGGFMWLYDDFDNSAQVAAYASAINVVFDEQVPEPTDDIITARASIHSGENQDKAFDGNRSTKWLDNGGVPSIFSPSWIQATLPVARVVNNLAITSANDVVERDPQNFNLQGSNDNGVSWTEIGAWINVIWSTRYERKLFSLSNIDSYSSYRVNIHKNQGDIFMTQIAEIELLGPENE
jgi:hypothetical protein